MKWSDLQAQTRFEVSPPGFSNLDAAGSTEAAAIAPWPNDQRLSGSDHDSASAEW